MSLHFYTSLTQRSEGKYWPCILPCTGTVAFHAKKATVSEFEQTGPNEYEGVIFQPGNPRVAIVL